MKELKKYTDIIRYGRSDTEDVLKVGDYITITEKIDGANSSFRKDEGNPLGITMYSRNTILDESNTLRGFYNWCLEKIKPIKEKLNNNYIYYGEWLCQHKCVYKKEMYKNFYLFSIWNVEKGKYESDKIVKLEAERLGLTTVPYFYEGKFISFEHLQQFIGKSQLTEVPDTGEGIVVKNVNYINKYGKQCFVKLVTEKFAEIKKQRPPKNPQKRELAIKLETVLTEARVEKILYKLIDENIFKKEDYYIANMGAILKITVPKILEDVMKEEKELFSSYEESEVKKLFGKKCPPFIRKLINEINIEKIKENKNDL